MELQSLELVDGALGASAHFKTQTSGSSREEEWGREKPQPDVGLPPTAIEQGRVEIHMGFTNDPGGRGFQEAGDAALPAPLYSTPPITLSPALLGRLQSISLLQYLSCLDHPTWAELPSGFLPTGVVG